MVCSTAYF